jgi:hypothetical protein
VSDASCAKRCCWRQQGNNQKQDDSAERSLESEEVSG